MARGHTINLPRGGKRPRREQVAVGYVRRSTDRQEQSIPDQKKVIEKYALDHDIALRKFYIDDAISGTSTVGRKAFQTLMEDARKPNCEFGLVIVYDVKRFGRIDNDEAGYYRHVLRSFGVEVIYASENFTGDRTDDLLRPVKQWQAREESKDLSKVTIRGLLSRATNYGRALPSTFSTNGSSIHPSGRTSSSGSSGGAEGVGGWWMGGAPPFGYDLAYESQTGEFLFHLRYMRDGTKTMFDRKWKEVRTLQRRETVAVSRRDRCRLVPSDAERVKVVKEIFKLYVEERRGFKAIADALNRKGVPAPRGREWSEHYGGLWTLSSVRSILLNPVYGGDMVWNRRTDARFHRIVQGGAVERKGLDRRRLEWNDERDWIVVPDAHEALVPRRVWQRARQLLAEKPESRMQVGVNPRTGREAGEPERGPRAIAWSGPRGKFLLSGLIVCSRCGSRYEGRINYGKRSPDEDGRRKKTYVYGCGGHIRRGKSVCSLGAVPQMAMEMAVVDAVLGYYEPLRGAGARAKITTLLHVQAAIDVEGNEAKRAEASKRLKQMDGKIRNLLDNLTPTNRELVDRRIEELERERAVIEHELEAIDYLAASLAGVDEAVAETATFLASLEATLREGEQIERQAAIRRCVKSLTINVEQRAADIAIHQVPTAGWDHEKETTRRSVPIK